MRVFEWDRNDIRDLQKKYRTRAAVIAAAGCVLCLLLFALHTRSTTVVILPIVFVIASVAASLTLGILLGRLGYLKQYAFVLEKAVRVALVTELTFVGNEVSVITRNHLQFTKSVFSNGDQTVSFCVLTPYRLPFEKGQKIRVTHVDDILLSAEVSDA